MALNAIGGAGVALPLPTNTLGNTPFGGANRISLPAGEVYTIPAGTYWVQPGPYSTLQVLDPVSNLWFAFSAGPSGAALVQSDGANYRIANLTGCPVGAVVTNAGTGYTSTPTVTVSSGSSTWQAILGGTVTSVTVSAGGTNYTMAPNVFLSAPPNGGIPATAHAVISGGAVTSIVVDNQGAGYTSAPTVTIVPNSMDPNYQTTSTVSVTTAKATAVLGGSGTVTAVVCTNPGTPIAAVPTLTISGGGGASATATPVMCLTITSVTVSTAGTGYSSNTAASINTVGGLTTATPTIANPAIGAGYFLPRQAQISATMSTTTVSTQAISTPQTGLIDGGLFQAAPALTIGATIGTAAPTTVAVASATLGSVTDYLFIQPV